MILLIPTPSVIDESALRVIMSAKVQVRVAETLRDFIKFSFDEGTQVIAIPADTLMLLVRHKTQLLHDLPYVLANLPGVAYPPSWMVFGSQLPLTDWIDLQQQLRKSGAVARSVDDPSKPMPSTAELEPVDRDLLGDLE